MMLADGQGWQEGTPEMSGMGIVEETGAVARQGNLI